MSAEFRGYLATARLPRVAGEQVRHFVWKHFVRDWPTRPTHRVRVSYVWVRACPIARSHHVRFVRVHWMLCAWVSSSSSSSSCRCAVLMNCAECVYTSVKNMQHDDVDCAVCLLRNMRQLVCVIVESVKWVCVANPLPLKITEPFLYPKSGQVFGLLLWHCYTFSISVRL